MTIKITYEDRNEKVLKTEDFKWDFCEDLEDIFFPGGEYSRVQPPLGYEVIRGEFYPDELTHLKYICAEV